MKHEAFSLIELMVVVAIIVALAAISVPLYLDYTIRARVMKTVVIGDDLLDNIISSYTMGKWDCNTATSFEYSGASFPLNNAVPPPGALQEDVSNIELSNGYSHFSCGDGSTIATLQIDTVNTPTNLEMVCILQDNNGTISKRCGVWGSTAYTWQVDPQYLPPGWDCLLGSGRTVRGSPC